MGGEGEASAQSSLSSHPGRPKLVSSVPFCSFCLFLLVLRTVPSLVDLLVKSAISHTRTVYTCPVPDIHQQTGRSEAAGVHLLTVPGRHIGRLVHPPWYPGRHIGTSHPAQRPPLLLSELTITVLFSSFRLFSSVLDSSDRPLGLVWALIASLCPSMEPREPSSPRCVRYPGSMVGSVSSPRCGVPG